MINPIEAIRQDYAQQTKTQKRISDYILKADDKICFMSLAELSKETHVTSVTLVKYCKRLGYSSFSDFKKDFQNYIQWIISPRRVIKANAESFQDKSRHELFLKLIKYEAQLVYDTMDKLNWNSIDQAVTLLQNARRIYLIGKGLSRPVISLFQTRLDFLCKDSRYISLDNINLLPNRLCNAGSDDVFVIFTFPNYSSVIKDVAKAVKEQLNCKIICITDKTSAPPATYADSLILCDTSGIVFFNSMTVPTALVNILASLLAVSTNQNVEKLSVLSHLRSEYDAPKVVSQLASEKLEL